MDEERGAEVEGRRVVFPLYFLICLRGTKQAGCTGDANRQ